MLPILARHIICPTHEWLLRRPTFGFLRELERSQWFSPDEQRSLQRHKLRALLQHAADCIPFYQQRFSEAGVDVRMDDPFSVLQALPILTKDQIRDAAAKLVWRDCPGGLHAHNTGGSTGEPLVFHVDRRRQAADQAARARTHRWFGVRPGDREAYLWGSPIELARSDRVKRFRDRLFNHLLLNAFDMSPATMDHYLQRLERFNPSCLFGYPSSVALLVEHARRANRQPDLPGLRAVFVTGEVCHAEHRESINRFFSVAVADGYGSREAGFIAHECPLGRMHVTGEQVVVEILEDGKPVSAGTFGDIIVTHLDAYAMPFIRYATGDRGRLLPGRCACGRGLGLMDVVAGRSTDFLYLPDGTVKHALSVIYPLRAMRGIRRFRVTQQENFAVTIDVVADDASERITCESVARKTAPVFGQDVPVHVRIVNHIPPSPSGKHRYVVSHAGHACATAKRGIATDDRR